MDIRPSALYSSVYVNYSRIEKKMKWAKGRWTIAWRIWFKGQVNRFIWIMQGLRKQLSVKRERWVLLYPLSPCKDYVTEPQSLCVSCPQTMALQMNVIFVPWHSNPCSMMSLSNSKGLFKRLFLLLCLEWWEQSVAGVWLRCWLVCVWQVVSYTVAFCWKWACEQTNHFLGKIYKHVSKGIFLFCIQNYYCWKLWAILNNHI